MKTLLLILLFGSSAFAQKPDNLEWRFIKEMSGTVSSQPGIEIETYAAQIARGDDRVRLLMRFDWPQGAPIEVFKKNVPAGFDVSSISRMQFGLRLNCKDYEVTVDNKSADIYQFNGKKLKSKEPPFKIESGNLLAKYFCEQGTSAPTKPPTLKPKS